MEILSVEDDPRDAVLLARALTPHPDTRVVTVGTLQAAWELLQAAPRRFQAVVLDLHLPDGSGGDLLHRIRQAGLPVAVVVLTGTTDLAVGVAMLREGADDFVTKDPESFDRLHELVVAAHQRFLEEVQRRSRSLRVLYAERHLHDQDLTVRQLAIFAPHLRIEVVDSAESALARLRQGDRRPDVLLLDLCLPGLSGIGALKAIRQELHLDLPVVLVTGAGDDQEALQALRLGASDWVPKHGGYLLQLPRIIENAHYRTELHRQQQALTASEARYRALVEQNPDLCLRMDLDGCLTFANASLGRLASANGGHCLGRRFLDLVVIEDRPALDQVLRRLAHGEARPCTLEVRLPGASGALHWFQFTFTAVHDSQGRTVELQGVGRDTTEVHRTEERRLTAEAGFYQAQKLHGLGQLAGGIAHDFNNLLSTILGHAELARRRLPAGSPALQHLDQIETAGRRSAHLTEQLLAFARRQKVPAAPVDLNRAVEETAGLVQGLLGPGIHLELALAADPPCIIANPGQMTQVIMNLVLNARDAMPAGGRIRLATALQDAPPNSLTGGRRFAVLRVEDQGVGIPEANRGRLFEPFFTTKAAGKGTGLGLATCHGIVVSHGGSIEVASTVGEGSVFSVLLPLASGVPGDALVPAEPNQQAAILLCEPDEPVRQLIAEVLTSAGATVLPASDAADGERLLEVYGAPLGLLVADTAEPRGQGLSLAETLRRRLPALPILLLVGGAESPDIRARIDALGAVLLKKPFAMADLLAQADALTGRMR